LSGDDIDPTLPRFGTDCFARELNDDETHNQQLTVFNQQSTICNRQLAIGNEHGYTHPRSK